MSDIHATKTRRTRSLSRRTASRPSCLRVFVAEPYETRCFGFALLLAAVGLSAQAPDRSKPPALGPAPTLKLPQIQKRQLSNGLPVWIVELHEVPVAQVNLIVMAGTADDPAGKYGIASLTTAMLTEGAGSRAALEIADAIDFLGADLGAASAIDSSAIRLHVPVARLAEALPIMADVALHPTFPKDELERLRQQRLTSLIQSRDDAATIAALAFSRVLYGPTHRFGTATMGTAETIKAFTVDDLRAFYTAMFRPDNAALLVVGDVTPDTVLPMVEKNFGGWKASGAKPTHPQFPTVPARSPPRNLSGRQAECSAVANQNRVDCRTAFDARLLSDSGGEHDPGRLIQLPAEHEPARNSRVHVRREFYVRHAHPAGTVLCRRRSADGQDVGIADRILQGIERHPAAHSGRRARACKELRRRSASPPGSRRRATSRGVSRKC